MAGQFVILSAVALGTLNALFLPISLLNMKTVIIHPPFFLFFLFFPLQCTFSPGEKIINPVKLSSGTGSVLFCVPLVISLYGDYPAALLTVRGITPSAWSNQSFSLLLHLYVSGDKERLSSA